MTSKPRSSFGIPTGWRTRRSKESRRDVPIAATQKCVSTSKIWRSSPWRAAWSTPRFATSAIRCLAFVGEAEAGTQNLHALNTYPANIPVRPGDIIGIFVGSPFGHCGTFTSNSGDTFDQFTGNPPLNTPVSPDTPGSLVRYPVSATVTTPDTVPTPPPPSNTGQRAAPPPQTTSQRGSRPARETSRPSPVRTTLVRWPPRWATRAGPRTASTALASGSAATASRSRSCGVPALTTAIMST